MSQASPIPEGFGTLTPHLIIKNAAGAIDLYKKAFGAEELCRMPGPDGKSVMHAELKIGGSVLMVAEEFGPEYPGPQSLGGSPVTLHLYVPDADKAFDQAVKAGCTPSMPIADVFWGDRYGKVKDPFGHHWSIATHKQDLTPEQIAKNAMEFFANMPGCGK